MMTGKLEYSRTRQVVFVTAVFGILLIICIGASVLTTKLLMDDTGRWAHDQPLGHQWLHEELGLTDAEAAAVDAFEPDYRRERGELLETFHARIGELREILASQDTYSAEVDGAIHRLHEVHGQLQQLSIAHYYDMLSVLPPDKQDRLRELAVKALSQPE